MAEATATAVSGLVRPQRRAWTTSRGCWRLVVLLGLAWVALVLLGGTAHAAPSDERRDAATPAAPGPIPLLGQTLADVGALATAPLEQVTQGLTPGAPAAAVPEPVAQVVTTATHTAANATEAVAKTGTGVAAAAPSYTPALAGLEAASELADSVRATAEATATGPELLDVQLPSFASTAAPVVGGLADQVDQSANDAAVAAVVLTAPLPVAQPLHGTLASVLDATALVTGALTSTGSLVGDAVDAVVTHAAGALAPALAVVTGPAGSIAVSAPGGTGAGAGAGSVPAPQPDLSTLLTDRGTAGAGLPSAAVRGTDAACPDRTAGRPAVPPPDTNASSRLVAQPASDITTELPVPVSGAGSTTGSGGSSAPTPGVDPTLARVESEPEFSASSTQPIEGPTGPMPGTPAADPSFSPD